MQRPEPRRPGPWTFAAALLLAGSFWFVGLGPRLFSLQALSAAGRLLGALFPPDLSPSFLAVTGAACVRTLAIALAGTSLSLLLGLPLGVLATPTLLRRGPLLAGEPPPHLLSAGALVSLGAGALLRLLRAVPDLVWALLFVVAFGLGPLPGALALALNNAGVIGRVAADLFEAVPPRPLAALHASGASRPQIFLTAVWPQAAASLAGYVLYTFECCVRAAAVLGFVGAGGLGQELQLSLRMFEYGQVLTLLAALWLLLLVTERASAWLRLRWQTAAPLPVLARVRALPTLLHSSAWLLALGAAFALAGFFAADDGGPGKLSRMATFAGRLFPPDLSPAFLRTLGEPLVQTVAISVVGTCVGLALGLCLGLPATRTLLFDDPREPGVRGPVSYTLRRGLHGLARGLLALLRSIPELVWVLLCIVAIGPGAASGALALGLHTGGVLGKLYAETLEEAPPRAAHALRAAGATRLQALLRATVPQVRETLASFTLLRWETNLRVSTVVGLAGGGGLGLVLYNDVQLGFHDRAATAVILVYALVAATDALASRLRAAPAGQLAAASMRARAR